MPDISWCLRSNKCFPYDRDFFRGFYAEADFISPNFQDCNGNSLIDDDTFIGFSLRTSMIVLLT
jgi:hypothetical protein